MTHNVRVVNINKLGEEFDPRTYTVTVRGNEPIIKRLRELREELTDGKDETAA